MEASVRILNSTNLNRHLSHSLFTKHSLKLFPPNHSSHLSFACPRKPSHNLLLNNRSSQSRINCVSRSSVSPLISNPLSFVLSLSSTHLFHSRVSNESLDRVSFDSKENYFSWNRAPEGVNGGELGILKDKGPVLTVVMLGWLGAEQKHLKRYIELYTSKGIHAVSFVIPVKDVLGFDLGRKIEKRILALTEELISWLSETEEDGRERALVFHTFSNTGWLVYGSILDYLQSRGEYASKIKGCMIDSGADPAIDPQVWAAGFSAALLKKRSSAAAPPYGELETGKGVSKVQEDEPPHLLETLLLSVLEKFFSVLLKLPDVNRRLTKIIRTLSKKAPQCPQLYLYSTADKVIPCDQVELFIQGQKMLGRKVSSRNFGSSPHVDHFRTYPREYSAEIHRFLEECVTTTVGHR